MLTCIRNTWKACSSSWWVYHRVSDSVDLGKGWGMLLLLSQRLHLENSWSKPLPSQLTVPPSIQLLRPKPRSHSWFFSFLHVLGWDLGDLDEETEFWRVYMTLPMSHIMALKPICLGGGQVLNLMLSSFPMIGKTSLCLHLFLHAGWGFSWEQMVV